MHSLPRGKEHWVDVVEPIPTSFGLDLSGISAHQDWTSMSKGRSIFSTAGPRDAFSCMSNWSDVRRMPNAQDFYSCQDADMHEASSLYQEHGHMSLHDTGANPGLSRLLSNGAHLLADDDAIARVEASQKDVAYSEASTLPFELAKGAIAQDKYMADIDRLTKQLHQEQARAREAKLKVERLQAVLRDTARFVEIEPEKLRDTIRHVLEIGWDNITWARGYTALHLAAEQGSASTFSLLFAMRADPSARDYKGRTAIDIARAKGHADCVAALEDLEASRSAGRGEAEGRLHA